MPPARLIPATASDSCQPVLVARNSAAISTANDANSQQHAASTVILLGEENGHLQRELSRQGHQVVCSASFHNLASPAYVHRLFELQKQEPPKQLWIRLPGIATSSGSRHDKRILCNIQRCIQNAHNSSCDIFILQDARARVWKHAVTREFCANLLELDIRWCLFNDFLDPATNLHYSRITKVYTNVILPEALAAPCVHSNHVCSKTVSPDVIALFYHVSD